LFKVNLHHKRNVLEDEGLDAYNPLIIPPPKPPQGEPARGSSKISVNKSG